LILEQKNILMTNLSYPFLFTTPDGLALEFNTNNTIINSDPILNRDIPKFKIKIDDSFFTNHFSIEFITDAIQFVFDRYYLLFESIVFTNDSNYDFILINTTDADNAFFNGELRIRQDVPSLLIIIHELIHAILSKRITNFRSHVLADSNLCNHLNIMSNAAPGLLLNLFTRLLINFNESNLTSFSLDNLYLPSNQIYGLEYSHCFNLVRNEKRNLNQKNSSIQNKDFSNNHLVKFLINKFAIEYKLLEQIKSFDKKEYPIDIYISQNLQYYKLKSKSKK